MQNHRKRTVSPKPTLSQDQNPKPKPLSLNLNPLICDARELAHGRQVSGLRSPRPAAGAHGCRVGGRHPG